MKSFRNLLIPVTVLFFASCQFGGGGEKYSLSNKEGLEAIKKLMCEKLGGDTEFVQLILVTGSVETATFQVGSLINKDKHLHYILTGNQTSEAETSLDEEEKAIPPAKLSSWNVDEILDYKDDAIAMIQEKTQDFSEFKLADMSLKRLADNQKEYYFSISAKKKDASPTIYGKRKSTGSLFFSFSFRTDPKSGKLISISGLED